MGKGKGQPEYWVATVKPGNILFELDGVPESVARESLRLAADKLPVRTKFLEPAPRGRRLTKHEDQRNHRDEHGRASDQEARPASGEFAFAFATAERPARTTEPVAVVAARRGANRNCAFAAKNDCGEEIILWPNKIDNQLLNRRRCRRRARVASARGSRKTRTGEVISSGMNKTIVVRTVTRVPHPKFGKIVKQMKNFTRTTKRTRPRPATRCGSWRRGR